ncbi:DUF4304 domain-containing protein [Aquipseudomonas ullengensis]|uniref:DUF4304 domain-containing protein n=1 Tax=Aquipseudomonas ullengensis TaxID=2759166 RepID=A0A7W4LMD7_9GAMM|nr:DUF4304 domain-containing protein [Pseudomonas ullengensis]MBB2495819.1 DUF4304 domain-containing protein [Pseudomonas ullengensis]
METRKKVKGPNDLIKDALKRVLVPHLTELGYSGKYPHFQKKQYDLLHLITISFSWPFSRFILDIGTFPAGDITDPSRYGKAIPEGKIDATFAFPRARLGPDSQVTSWFHYSDFGSDIEKYETIAKEVSSLLYQAEAWLESRVVGSCIQTLG